MSNVIVFMSDEHNPRYSSPYGPDFAKWKPPGSVRCV